MDDRMVVSEIGEQWSPKTAPPRIADTVADRVMGSASEAWNTSGIANGVKIAIVPQEVPVANETVAATRKITMGSRPGGTAGPTAPLMNPAVARSVQTWPRDQARVSTTNAMSMLLNPLIIASSASRMVSAR